MASNTYKNPLSKNTRRTPVLNRDLPPHRDIEVAEVLAIEYEGQKAGVILYRSLATVNTNAVQSLGSGDASSTKTANIAIPLFANIRIYPVIGEQVALIRLGNTYYIPLNALNNPISNQVPFVFGSSRSANASDLAKAVTSTKNTFKVDKNKKYYITGIYPGDVMLEGRNGNSIKLGSTIKFGEGANSLYSKSDLSKNGDPIIIIRNDPGSAFEDIQKDGASIYLCSTQKILVDQGKNGFEGITGTWSTLNVSAQAVEIEEQETITNTTATSPDSSRPGNPVPPDPENNASSSTSSNTNALSDPGFQQPSSGGPVEVAPPSTGYLKPGNLTISQEGLRALIREEGSRKVVYDDKSGKSIASYADASGYPTIGVGHLITKRERDRFAPYLKGAGAMTDNEVQKLLLEDLGSRIRYLNNVLKVEVTQNMFDALLSMMFNTGEGNKFFKQAVRLTNQKKYQEAAGVIKSGPVTSKGKVFAGLVRRRTNESNTYIA